MPADGWPRPPECGLRTPPAGAAQPLWPGEPGKSARTGRTPHLQRRPPRLLHLRIASRSAPHEQAMGIYAEIGFWSTCLSRDRAIHPDGCGISTARTNAQQKPIDFGNEQGGPGAAYGWDACEPRIGRFLCHQNVEKPRPAYDVNTIALPIEEQVVSIAARVDSTRRCAGLFRECHEFCVVPECYEHPPAIMIEGHREVCGIFHCP